MKQYILKFIVDWSNEDVVEWLNCCLLLPQYEDAFRAHEIDGRDLIDLTDDNYKYDLNVIKLHDRKYIQRQVLEALKNYRNKLGGKVEMKEYKSEKMVVEIVYEQEKLKLKADFKKSIKNVRREACSIFGLEEEWLVKK